MARRGIGGHHSASAATVEWLTPPEVLAALGEFDLDPCAPIEQPWPTAARRHTILDDGLAQPWSGRVWLNPPYENGEIERWLGRMVEHGRGTALIFARTETEAFHRGVWAAASAVLFMRGRVHFHVGEAFSVVRTRQTFEAGARAKGNAGAPTVLVAYGADDADVLAECGIDGQFVPLMIGRSILIAMRVETWREIVEAALVGHDGPVRVADVWRAVSSHPRARRSRHAREKVRQTLQRHAERVGPDRWRRKETA